MRADVLRAVIVMGVVLFGGAPPASAIQPLADFTNCGISGGVQWVVEDPVNHYLTIGTGFSGGTEFIEDNNNPSQTFDCTPTKSIFVGEALYIALHPRELQGNHPNDRRIFLASENRGLFGWYDPPSNSFTSATASGVNKCGTSIGYRPANDSVYFGFVSCTGAN